MYFTRFIYLAFTFFIAATMLSCIKDVDFDNTRDIAFTPDIQSDLLIFEVDSDDFTHPTTGAYLNVIRDTVRLEFLDDDYIQDNLQLVEFSFKYRNSFPQSFLNKISFLSENNRLQHQISYPINPGRQNTMVVTEHIEVIGPDRINVIKNSIKMVVEIEVMQNSTTFDGQLNFESKGLFSFEF